MNAITGLNTAIHLAIRSRHRVRIGTTVCKPVSGKKKTHMNAPQLDTSPKVSDEVRKTPCYMCACRCGINVHMKEGKVAYIEGNKDHPVNQGVRCAKGSAGIKQHNAPSRLRAPV